VTQITEGRINPVLMSSTVAVNSILEQAMKAQRKNRGIVLLFL
jgi:N-methylhydantoinase A/oxoprolinase/acetone carboxylase beta subunit